MRASPKDVQELKALDGRLKSLDHVSSPREAALWMCCELVVARVGVCGCNYPPEPKSHLSSTAAQGSLRRASLAHN